MATGDKRGWLALSEPDAGSDVAAIRTTATRDGDRYLVNGVKFWITNGRHGNTFLLLAKTDPDAQPPHSGISAFIVEKGAPGFTVSRDIRKLGYKGI
jgi:alkylation response protein AidB-like acyl-CoA dehydrogenase